MEQALIDSLQEDLNTVYKDDTDKPVCAPFNTFGKKIIERLPLITGKILVLSDVGLLFALIRRLVQEKLDVKDVLFIGHTGAQVKFSQELGVNAQLVCYNELSDWFKKDLGMQFDVVIGNPPYQGAKNGGGDGSGNAIWQKFVTKAFELCNKDGHIALITPCDWRLGARKKLKDAQKYLFSQQIVHLKTHFKFPGAHLMTDWYVVQHRDASEPAMVEFRDVIKPFMIHGDVRYICQHQSDMVNSIISKIFRGDNNSFYYRKMMGGLDKRDTTINGKFKFAHGSKFFTRNLVKEYENPHIHQHEKKVIVSAVGAFHAVFDDGQYGIGDHIHYVLVPSRNVGEFLVQFFKDFGPFIANVMTFNFMKGEASTFANNPTLLKKIQLEDTKNDLFEHFGLDDMEIKYINSFK